MNDPIIHAPLSKIVEAIKNQEDSIIEYYFSSATINEDKLTTALSSLGGEPKCKDCNDGGQVPIGEEQGQLLYADCPCQPPNPSEREVLEGFKKHYDENSGGYLLNPWLITSYLAEKQSKTE